MNLKRRQLALFKFTTALGNRKEYKGRPCPQHSVREDLLYFCEDHTRLIHVIPEQALFVYRADTELQKEWGVGRRARTEGRIEHPEKSAFLTYIE